jgi:hypothetical protein
MNSEFECEDALEIVVVFLPSKESCKDCLQGRDWNHKCDVSCELSWNSKCSSMTKLDIRALMKIKKCTRSRIIVKVKIGEE